MSQRKTIINPSSLTKFRKLKLKDMELLYMLTAKTVQISLEKERIKSKSIFAMNLKQIIKVLNTK